MFKKAHPIWLDGLAGHMNIQAVFRANFMYHGGNACLCITAASLYRIHINDVFVGYGPARAPHRHARVDRLDVARFLSDGENHIRIEVAGYNCYSFYTLKQLSFLCAEILIHDDAIIYTGRDFTGSRVAARAQKVMRYSFQRPFTEVWDLASPDLDMPVQECHLSLTYLPRELALPDYELIVLDCVIGGGRISRDNLLPLRKDERYVLGISPICSGWTEAEIPYIPAYLHQSFRYHPSDTYTDTLGLTKLQADSYLLVDSGRNHTGFIRLQLQVNHDTHLMVSFDEKLYDGCVDPRQIEMINLVDYHLPARKEPYQLETFEAYEFRYAMILVVEGEVILSGLQLRSYIYPVTASDIGTDDDILRKIDRAAIETYRQNTLDVYMDCPSRERGGWLCDSYYTAQAEAAFTGASQVERVFMRNFLLYDRDTNIPAGMLPMCYPADHPDGKFIPQWAFWFILELDQFFERCPDVDPADYRKLCYDLINFLETYTNRSGLLENLPSWNFIEWSRANDWTLDVNYPTNMLYARVLEIIGTRYLDDHLLERCSCIRDEVRSRAFNGLYFVDHAVRDKAGVLVNCDDISEVCQYYAIRFGLISLDDPAYSDLMQTVLNVFGPSRSVDGRMPVEPANALMGVYLRMEILLELGCYDQLLSEIKSYFGHMAAVSGTLWEHCDPSASMNHGFASFAGVAIRKALQEMHPCQPVHQ